MQVLKTLIKSHPNKNGENLSPQKLLFRSGLSQRQGNKKLLIKTIFEISERGQGFAMDVEEW